MYQAKNWKYGGPADSAELVTISVVVAKISVYGESERRYCEDAIHALTLYKNTLPEGAAPYWVKEITIK